MAWSVQCSNLNGTAELEGRLIIRSLGDVRRIEASDDRDLGEDRVLTTVSYSFKYDEYFLLTNFSLPPVLLLSIR